MMEKRLGKRFWAALVIFGLMGQVAWVVENMYFNVFIYKMFHASASDISLMVGASSVAATVTTILVGAFTDYTGKRKTFICGGYIAWGISILAFALIRVDVLTPIAGSALQAAALGITLVIVLDCVMTFLGSSANDACFNAWVTDWGDGSNRGKIEGIHSMMPLVATLVVFGGFSAFDLDRAESWTMIYLIVGVMVLLIGILGIFLIDENAGNGGKAFREDRACHGDKEFREDKACHGDKEFREDKACHGDKEFREDKACHEDKAFHGDKAFRGEQACREDKECHRDKAFQGGKEFHGDKAFQGEQEPHDDKAFHESKEKPACREAVAGSENAKEVKSSYRVNLVYSFRLSVIKENPLLYAVLGAFAIFGISINIFMPYLILYYEKTLGMDNYVMIMAPAIVLAAAATACYGNLFDLLGFKSSVLPAIGFLMAGYVLLYVGTGTGIVFVGSLLMMTGYLTGMAVFGAMIRSHIPEEKAGQFQGIRMIGQVLIPGMIGPAIGAVVLSDAEQIVNSDGTTSFLPNRNIYMAALAAAVLLVVILFIIFRVMRDGHHSLVSQAGEELLDRFSGKENQKGEEDVWGRYPRPQMRRNSFFCLNGNWQLHDQQVLVPFPPQSLLSGYQGHVGASLEYSRCFEMPFAWKDGRVLLHFGAVDQVAEIFLNDHFAGKHEGGYLPFSCDITEYIREGENRLVVKARDTLSPVYPYGKQRKNRGGMWYTPVSGIWQSVWLECVPRVYIRKLDIIADRSKVCVTVVSSENGCGMELDGVNSGRGASGIKEDGNGIGKHGIQVSIKLHDGSIYTAHAEGNQIEIDLTEIKLADGTNYQPVMWTTEHPYLYEMTVAMGEDIVSSYFGLRTIEIKKEDGLPRVCLNGEPVFLHGVLDQGYFCDGIYLPAREEEYEQDILRMKRLGFNLLRKHIKIEPECFYYYCDVHGMLVMQDMVNSGVYSWIKDTALPTIGCSLSGNGTIWGRKRRRDFFVESMKETIAHLRNHPSVIAYTIFNEGWGQFESDTMYELAKGLDSTRLYDATSGWFQGRKSDFDSQHIYFKKLEIPETPEKPVLVSECGGYSYGIPGHVFAKFTRFGYGDCVDSEELTERIRKLYEDIILPAIPQGVCGCIYTQLSDVEDETNGLYTYDRKVCKVVAGVMKEIGEQCKKAWH